MAMTNHERVGKALDLLKDGLAPFVEREMKAQHAQQWFGKIVRGRIPLLKDAVVHGSLLRYSIRIVVTTANPRRILRNRERQGGERVGRAALVG
jgi:hypothetical protein